MAEILPNRSVLFQEYLSAQVNTDTAELGGLDLKNADEKVPEAVFCLNNVKINSYDK